MGFFLPIMRYTRLSKDQFEALHLEFARFLAAQSLDAKQWQELKTNQPESVALFLDRFSDLVWEDILTKVQYLEQWSAHQHISIKRTDTQLESIIVKSNYTLPIDQSDGWQWVLENIHSDEVVIYRGTKQLGDDPKRELFKLIEQGAEISDGSHYKVLHNLFKTQE